MIVSERILRFRDVFSFGLVIFDLELFSSCDECLSVVTIRWILRFSFVGFFDLVCGFSDFGVFV